MPEINRYERLYTQLLTSAEQLHQSNKRRIRRGVYELLLLPFVLTLILLITGSSRIGFLLVWVFCMFAMSAYLIIVEYLDHYIQKTLSEVSESELEFDDLIRHPDLSERTQLERLERLEARLHPLLARVAERRAGAAAGRAAAAKPSAPDGANPPAEAAAPDAETPVPEVEAPVPDVEAPAPTAEAPVPPAADAEPVSEAVFSAGEPAARLPEWAQDEKLADILYEATVDDVEETLTDADIDAILDEFSSESEVTT